MVLVMSTEPKPSSESPLVIQQRRQANILLLRLQWLFIVLLALALVWLYVSQQRFESQIKERLNNNEQVVTRLNEMDDRLFAISQQTAPAPKAPLTSQAQNQLDLLRIQMQAADSLLADNNYSAAIDLLTGLQWQLSQANNEIAPALNIVIKQSLSDDIKRLQARSAQPSPWQLQSLAIQDIQTFLHRYEKSVDSRSVTKSNEQSSHTLPSKNTSLSRRQLIIHEALMTLNLAIQASNMREPDQLTRYLSQTRAQLQPLVVPTQAKDHSVSKGESSTEQKTANLSAANANSDKSAVKTPSNISEVITWLDELIASPPESMPLLTTQVLNQPKNNQ